MLEHSDEGQGGASIAVKQNQMGKLLAPGRVHLMHVLFFIDSNISEFEMRVYFQIGKS